MATPWSLTCSQYCPVQRRKGKTIADSDNAIKQPDKDIKLYYLILQ